MELRDRLTAMVEPVVNGLGYELVLLEYAPSRRTGTLRLFIDKPAGIVVEDCERVSREVAALLDVEDPVPGAYRLEVSSPGLDRPLVKPEHFERFIGEKIRVEMMAPIAGQRRFRGVLLGIDGRTVTLETEQAQRVMLPLSDIEQARLVPDFERELKNS
jgi:ribosome maturation factor RimP